jgi:outer membrane immunogenic protein
VKIKSTIVVAAATGASLAPSAANAAPPQTSAAPVWSWTGFYVGAHIGGAWQDNQTQGRTQGAYVGDTIWFPFGNKTTPSGFIGGGQVGYNWQSGAFVYGLEADISDFSGSQSTSQSAGPTLTPVTVTSQNQIGWVGTVRGRVGVTVVPQAVLYVTGGWAYGNVSNLHSEAGGGAIANWQENATRSGYAVGGGLDYMIAPHWIVRIEGMYVDLGSKTLNAPNSGACVNLCDPVIFSNTATMVRGAVNYKF